MLHYKTKNLKHKLNVLTNFADAQLLYELIKVPSTQSSHFPSSIILYCGNLDLKPYNCILLLIIVLQHEQHQHEQRRNPLQERRKVKRGLLVHQNKRFCYNFNRCHGNLALCINYNQFLIE